MDESRRDLIRKGAAVGAAAWAAPVLTVLPAAPAMAASPVDPCGVEQSLFAVALYTPPGGGLVDRPNVLGSFTVGSCTSGPPFRSGDEPPTAGVDLTTSAAVGLTFNQVDISHVITGLQQSPVTLTLVDTCCVFTRITAHVHRFGAPTDPDCPDPYYRVAGAADNHLLITAGGYGTQSITVQPNTAQDFCSGGNQSLHWGSPNQDIGCAGSANGPGEWYGQPLGYMLIELTCEQ